MGTTAGFSGVGLVNFHERLTGGLKGRGRMIGNTSKMSVKFEPKSVERNSSMDTSRAPLRRMTQTTAASIEIVTDEWNKKNFAIATRARIDDIAADDATTINQVLPANAVVGDVLSLSKRNVNNVVITDSTGAPKTLALGTNYSLDPFSGDITLLDLTAGGPFVQPLKGAFKQGAVTVMAGLAIPDTELWIGLNGTNVDTGEKGVADFFRVRLDPAQVFDFLNTDFNDFTFNGSVLQDTTKLSTAIGGQYFQFAVPTTIA